MATPQVYGQAQSAPAAELQRQMATAAAQTGARAAADRARTGAYEITVYIQENPTSLKTLCFIIGLLLVIFSIVTLINPFAVLFMPRHYLANVYNIFFGVVICICDGKESWMRSCGDVQAKLFQKAFILANPTGRAMFYIYVGTMTMLLVPGDGLWMIIYIILGSALCLLALIMLFLQYCGHLCGSRTYGQMSSQNSGQV